MSRLKVILALGDVAHRAVHLAMRIDPTMRFSHGASYKVDSDRWLVDCYHCSRPNVATGVLTNEMLESTLNRVRGLLD